MKTMETDVLVIGAGGAGLRAAIEAHDLGAKVILIGKSKYGDAHTVLATGGINGALATTDRKDTWLIHAADTLREGQFLADYKFVETLCKNAPAAILELEKWGARFAKDKNGKLIQRFFGAHTYRRTCFFGDQTGKEIIRVLLRQVEKRKIKTLDEIVILHLIVDKNSVKGAVGINRKNGNIIVFNARSIVLATGGHSKIYSISSSRYYENLGDGISLAYEVGCELMDMEMVQFHPTGMVWPKNMVGTLVTEAVRGEGGKLFNKNNERFMERYDKKRMELSARDVVARSNYNEIIRGRGTKHSGVWLDITHKPAAYIKKRLPKMYTQFKAVGIDITKDRMEVAPTSHYSMGGIRTDLSCETSVGGLFAVGEVTGDIHGANRLGGNSLAETIVFGKITGKEAVKAARKRKLEKISLKDLENVTAEISEFFNLEGNINPMKVKEEAQDIMWKHVGILRNEKSMAKGLKKLRHLENKLKSLRIRSVEDLINAYEAKSIILAGEIVTKSAMIRKESRGAHYRNDYPNKNNRWLKHVICREVGGGRKFYFKKTLEIRGKLREELKRESKTGYHFLE